MESNFIGKKVIIRSKGAGVFFGTLVRRDGRECELKDARRIWKWDGAASLSELAAAGTAKPRDCRFPAPVESIEVFNLLEVIPCTEQAAASIESVPVWSAR